MPKGHSAYFRFVRGLIYSGTGRRRSQALSQALAHAETVLRKSVFLGFLGGRGRRGGDE